MSVRIILRGRLKIVLRSLKDDFQGSLKQTKKRKNDRKVTENNLTVSEVGLG